jgi:transposase
MDETTTCVGVDAHKKTISAAVAEPGRDGVVRALGSIANQPATVARLAKKLAAAHGKLRFCYEAGPCGYGLYRQLTALGHDCVVAAPSLIPRRPGERVKTDRRDSLTLARSDRAGELTLVWVPDPAHEAMRDLVRRREQAVAELRRHRQHLQALLLRHGRIWLGETSWTRAHLAWITGLTWRYPAHRILVEDHLAAITAARARRDRLTDAIAALLSDWHWAPVVSALQAMRGIALISAVSVVAAIGDDGAVTRHYAVGTEQRRNAGWLEGCRASLRGATWRSRGASRSTHGARCSAFLPSLAAYYAVTGFGQAAECAYAFPRYASLICVIGQNRAESGAG